MWPLLLFYIKCTGSKFFTVEWCNVAPVLVIRFLLATHQC